VSRRLLHGREEFNSFPGAGACWEFSYLRGTWPRCVE
jgi:hypothetical protein